MSHINKVLLVFAIMVCISEAYFREPGSQCLCQRLSMSSGSKSNPKDIKIYPATIFCDRVEILVTTNNGGRFCLNPNLKAVKMFLSKLMRK